MPVTCRFLRFAITLISLCIQYDFLLAFPSISIKSYANYRRQEAHMKQKLRTGNSLSTEDILCDVDSKNRREAVKRIISSIVIPMTLLPFSTQPSEAGIPEIDAKSGLLFFPKGEMLAGGSDLTRGIKLQSREGALSKNLFIGGTKSSGLLQTVYDTRFITYLARFLLNFDPGAKSWWDEQDFNGDDYRDGFENKKQLKFGEFAESVEIGLVDYFLGPYGSYDQAVKAGLLASNQYRDRSDTIRGIVDGFKAQYTGSNDANPATTPRKKVRLNLAKQGILNLLALLKVRYSSTEAKRQLAILFSLISDPKLQPTDEIKSLLGEIDNASISNVDILGLGVSDNIRSSSRHGGGYSKADFPIITVEPPPALGDEYRVAKISPCLNVTTRVLRITVTDGGEGYTAIPTVQVVQDGAKIICEACPIVGRNGSVESIIVLNPGFGYGGYGMEPKPPQVIISPPTKRGKGGKTLGRRRRVAKAYAELEYSITGLQVIDGGNGYVLTEPPEILISRPREDPDWYVSPIEQKFWRIEESDFVTTNVSKLASNNFVDGKGVTDEMQTRLISDPLVMFPSSLRPTRTSLGSDMGVYILRNLAPAPPYIILPSSRYRAFDPIFGVISNKPVTKSARSLTPGEYSRLALSGAVCTVLVRTALNPLELVKTKIQLRNDAELMDFALQRRILRSKTEKSDADNNTMTNSSGVSVNIGTIDVITSLVEKRGVLSLFQSADITFLASLVFGSFGFGATELFRRSFSSIFFPEDMGNQLGQELFLLVAAAAASIITSAAAAPFETLRVRSMGYTEPKSVNYVFSDFVNEKRRLSQKREEDSISVPTDPQTNLILSDLRKNDIGPFFSGFYPIVSRELPFAVAKFLAFDTIARIIISFINLQPQVNEPVEVGVGAVGLAVSAVSGAIAGIAGAFVSHPADLILTLTSAAKKQKADVLTDRKENDDDWKVIVEDLLNKPGSFANLFVGLPARSTFFFMVIGLQFFLYDYLKGVFRVGSDDLTLVLDVFYAVRQGL